MAQQMNQRSRREAMQRIQTGVIGLCAVLLIVAFANIVVTNLRPDAGQTIAAAGQAPADSLAANVAAPPPQDSEAFADLGLTPKSDASASQATPVGPSVPDLEPDPQLSQPMDQDPKGSAKPAPRN